MLSHTDPSAVFNSANPNATPFAGHVKTPTLRNVDKRRGNGFPKAYMHNGYFKTLEQVVHFYNTSTLLRDPVACPAGTTAAQAMARNCWPVPEFDTPNQAGNFGLLGKPWTHRGRRGSARVILKDADRYSDAQAATALQGG